MKNMYKLLLVDDNEETLASIQKYLTSTGRFIVRPVGAFHHALQEAVDFGPEVIILDLKDQRTDEYLGVEVASKIREVPRLQNVPLIYYTASDLDSSSPTGPLAERVDSGRQLGGVSNQSLEYLVTKGSIHPSKFVQWILGILEKTRDVTTTGQANHGGVSSNTSDSNL